MKGRETDGELDARIRQLCDEVQQKKRELRTAEAKRIRRMCGPRRRYPYTRELRELSNKFVNIGYKALATELHPDAGGTEDVFARLLKVRDRLKASL